MAQSSGMSGMTVALVALPVALTGVAVGVLLPQEQVLQACSNAYSAARDSQALTLLGRGLLLFNVAMLFQQIWYRCTSPGTFRRMCQPLYAAFGVQASPPPPISSPFVETEVAKDTVEVDDGPEDWPVGKQDLALFRERAEQENLEEGKWEKFVDKLVPDTLKYIAWRRMTSSKKSEYKSLTVIPDCTPHEVRMRPRPRTRP